MCLLTLLLGSAKGDLARHTESITVFDDDGVAWPFPNFTDRTTVYLQVTSLTAVVSVWPLCSTQVQFIVMLTQVPALGFTRLSVLFFYRR